jgi:hypothetical protein
VSFSDGFVPTPRVTLELARIVDLPETRSERKY